MLVEQELAEAWRVSGSLNWFTNEIDALETTLFFPTPRPFSLEASQDETWDFTLNNQFRLPRAAELLVTFVYYGRRNVPQGWERARSSLDLATTWPVMDERAEFVLTFTDVFNDFAVQREIEGRGFTALYENFLESQVATLGVRLRF